MIDHTSYFVIEATESEHEAVESIISEYLEGIDGAELIYYRKLENGHTPLLREFKIKAQDGRLLRRTTNWIREEFEDQLRSNRIN